MDIVRWKVSRPPQFAVLSNANKAKKDNMDIQYAPLRPMEDFLTAGARFQIPDFNKEDRWFNRIVSNLLYYQTNYFLCALGIFFLVGFFHPQEMLAGISTMVIAKFAYLSEKKPLLFASSR